MIWEQRQGGQGCMRLRRGLSASQTQGSGFYPAENRRSLKDSVARDNVMKMTLRRPVSGTGCKINRALLYTRQEAIHL